MKITYYGHSAFGLKIGGKDILLDPFISGNPLAASVQVDSLPADYILLTHAHYDHVLDVEAVAVRTGATLICNHEMAMHYQAKGYPCHEMNIGGSWDFDFGRVKMVYATHSSSFADNGYGGNPAGYVIHAGSKTLYIAGDTGLTMDMKLIPLFFKLDVAIMPIGGNFTMDVDEALLASDFVECNRIIGMHYDTMDIIQVNHTQVQKRFAEKGKELFLLEIGKSLTL